MKKTGLIFDVDGTLWDAREEVAASWSEVTRKHNLGSVSVDDMSKTMGLPMSMIADALFPQLEPASRLDLLNECTENELIYLRKHPGKTYEREEETLKYLKECGFPLLILSNAQPGYIETFLDSCDLSAYFIDHICWGDTGYQKAENMKLIAKRNALDDFIYIGDTEMDEIEANKAGARFIFASYGFGKSKAPFMSLKSFSDLLLLPSSLHK